MTQVNPRPLRESRSLPARLSEQLRIRITDGEWPPGTRLPSEQELGAEYGVSRATVRASLQRLEETGLVRIRHGAGSFVTQYNHTVRAGLHELRSMTQIITEQGHECAIEYHHQELRISTTEEQRQLERADPIPVLAGERLLRSDGEPLAFDYFVIARDATPAGTDLGDEALTGSVFEFLERFDLVPHQAVAAVRAIHDASVGWAPHRPAASLYLCLEQVQYLATGTPLTWGRTYFIEDRFQFVIVRSSSTSSALEDRSP